MSSVLLMPGERVDAILVADKVPGDYWIDVATLDGHNSPAMLRYIDDDDGSDWEASPKARPTIGAPTAELGCLIRPPAVTSAAEARGSAVRGGPEAEGAPLDLDLSRGRQLPAHPSVPRPPRSTRELRLYLVLGSDPAMATPSDLLGNSASRSGGQVGSGVIGRVPGMDLAVEPMSGCPPLQDGGKNR